MLAENTPAAALAENVGNIMAIEHVNVTIPDQSLGTAFYAVGLGCTRDPYLMVGLNNMWMNLGEQQFHLPTSQPMRLRGHVGVVLPSLAGLRARLAQAQPLLAGTQFAWQEAGDHLALTCPWGNRFRCYEAGAFGAMRRGIPYVELDVPVGAAAGIARFYEQVFLAPTRLDAAGGAVARVAIGAGQELRFRETAAPGAEYDGHHIAIYVANFAAPYQYLAAHGLITRDIQDSQFRFEDIVEPASGEPLFKIEHEVRSLRHWGFRRQQHLVNRELD